MREGEGEMRERGGKGTVGKRASWDYTIQLSQLFLSQIRKGILNLGINQRS